MICSLADAFNHVIEVKLKKKCMYGIVFSVRGSNIKVENHLLILYVTKLSDIIMIQKIFKDFILLYYV